jgi:hypothetical protein
MLFIRDDPTGLSGKKNFCLSRRCAAILHKADGSAASVAMGALTWEAIATTLASTLPTEAWPLALILTP